MNDEMQFELIKGDYFLMMSQVEKNKKEKEEVQYNYDRLIEDFFTNILKLDKNYFEYFNINIKWFNMTFEDAKKVICKDYYTKINN